MLKLTLEQFQALQLAAFAGGRLRRRHGGLWTGSAKNQHNGRADTRIANQLVRLDLAKFSRYQDGPHGPYPVELELTSNAFGSFEIVKPEAKANDRK